MLKQVQHNSFTFYFRPNWTIKYKLNGASDGLISEPFKELLTEIDSSESRGVIYRINLFKVA